MEAEDQSSFCSSQVMAAIKAVFSAWKELLKVPVGACQEWISVLPLQTITPAPPFSVPLRVEPSVKMCKSVGP